MFAESSHAAIASGAGPRIGLREAPHSAKSTFHFGDCPDGVVLGPCKCGCGRRHSLTETTRIELARESEALDLEQFVGKLGGVLALRPPAA
jgi:hypothetical protein